jgi:hypothetical protein
MVVTRFDSCPWRVPRWQILGRQKIANSVLQRPIISICEAIDLNVNSIGKY